MISKQKHLESLATPGWPCYERPVFCTKYLLKPILVMNAQSFVQNTF